MGGTREREKVARAVIRDSRGSAGVKSPGRVPPRAFPPGPGERQSRARSNACLPLPRIPNSPLLPLRPPVSVRDVFPRACFPRSRAAPHSFRVFFPGSSLCRACLNVESEARARGSEGRERKQPGHVPIPMRERTGRAQQPEDVQRKQSAGK